MKYQLVGNSDRFKKKIWFDNKNCVILEKEERYIWKQIIWVF